MTEKQMQQIKSWIDMSRALSGINFSIIIILFLLFLNGCFKGRGY